MKRALFLVLLFAGLNLTASAAQLDRVEYFIDSDPGYGNGTAVTVSPAEQIDADFTIDLSSAAAGFHLLGVRSRDSSGQWSLTFTQPFYVAPAAALEVPDVTALEYFIDDDPGFGKGISVPVKAGAMIDETFVVNLAGISNGSHTLYVRVRDSKGAWSLVHSTPFVATLPAVAPPNILGQPTDKTATVGDSVTFSVAAEGAVPLFR